MLQPQPSRDSLAGHTLADRFLACRALTEALAGPLSDADATAQSMPDASPAKWHLAHTTWFLETFVLLPHVPGYRVHDERFGYLFNSYYEAAGPRHARPERGLLTRPALGAILDWRARVTDAVTTVLPTLPTAALDLIELGLAHEAQHQELLLTDILHLFSRNPLAPALYAPRPAERSAAAPLAWAAHPGGIAEIGAVPGSFAFDCERPRHRVLLEPFELASRPVTNAEWSEFIADCGYRTPTLWLSDGWAWVQREGIAGPLHWRGETNEFTLAGEQARDPAAPVAHVSHYEADAYATWAGARLPTEYEWEAAAAALDPTQGNLLDGPGAIRPGPRGSPFGDVWEWTASAFLPYPRFRPAPGAVGEYTAKFMSGQMVLKGGSCATPRGSVGAHTRNYFPPSARWQFTGLRLARNA